MNGTVREAAGGGRGLREPFRRLAFNAPRLVASAVALALSALALVLLAKSR